MLAGTCGGGVNAVHCADKMCRVQSHRLIHALNKFRTSIYMFCNDYIDSQIDSQRDRETDEEIRTLTYKTEIVRKKMHKCIFTYTGTPARDSYVSSGFKEHLTV